MSMPQQYRKKPVAIEAVRVTMHNADDVAAWVGGSAAAGLSCVDIPTLEGTMRAGLGDYVIRGVKGEFYPCKPDIFDATYEALGADR